MTECVQWRTICENTIEYSEAVDHEACFNKLITIWKTQCQSVNRRLAASVLLLQDSEEYGKVLQALSKEIFTIISDSKIPIEIRKLVPRTTKFSDKCYEVSFENSSSNDMFVHSFHPVQLDPSGSEASHSHIPVAYTLSVKILSENSLRLNLSVPVNCLDSSLSWLIHTAYSTMKKWLQHIDLSKEIRPSNRLLCAEKYAVTYRSLKEGRGKEIVENWSEKTDPQKFVYEDCGIATYLIETWKRIGRHPKCFADIGCGNGLLVYLLNKEGFSGIGLDVRSRKIWSTMFAESDLREVTVVPTIPSTGIPEEADYLIGNHSDELTPWIPIIAARRKCDFLLIPCCPFDFYGKYTARAGDNGSSYNGFLNFVKDICSSLGYIVEEDRMSIPSTKRICFICTIPPTGLSNDIEEVIQRLLTQKSKQAKSFIARPMKQDVRNCSHIVGDTRDRLVSLIFNMLLEASEKRIEGWRCGGELPLSTLIESVTPEDRQLMKQQDGGIQTFLKNQYQIFQVIGGKVMIRDWRTTKKAPAKKPPSTPCWMLANHPDGCPHRENCRFKH